MTMRFSVIIEKKSQLQQVRFIRWKNIVFQSQDSFMHPPKKKMIATMNPAIIVKMVTGKELKVAITAAIYNLLWFSRLPFEFRGAMALIYENISIDHK